MSTQSTITTHPVERLVNQLNEENQAYPIEEFDTFRLKPNSKSPATPRGFYDAVEGQGYEHFMQYCENCENSEGNELSQYNVGVRTGNGLLIIDVDVHAQDKNGFDSLELFLSEHGIGKHEMNTLSVTTPNDGLHLYFKYEPLEFRIESFNNLLPGLDIKAESGYVVGAGSMIDKKSYSIVENKQIRDLPLGLAFYLANLTEERKKKRNLKPEKNSGVATSTLRPLTESEVKHYLQYLSPNCNRDEWLRVGFSIKDCLPNSVGFDLFDVWSQGSAHKYSHEETVKLWNSCRPGNGITSSTLVYKAKKNGAPHYTVPGSEDLDFSDLEQKNTDEKDDGTKKEILHSNIDIGNCINQPQENSINQLQGASINQPQEDSMKYFDEDFNDEFKTLTNEEYEERDAFADKQLVKVEPDPLPEKVLKQWPAFYEIVKDMYDNAPFKYPDASILSSLHLLSSLFTPLVDKPINIYSALIMPTAAGKDYYLKQPEKYFNALEKMHKDEIYSNIDEENRRKGLKDSTGLYTNEDAKNDEDRKTKQKPKAAKKPKMHPHFIAPPASIQGFQRIAQDRPDRTIIHEEIFPGFLDKALDDKNAIMQQFVASILNLHSSDKLRSVANKKKDDSSDEVNGIALSIFGSGVPKSAETFFANEETESRGLTNRFIKVYITDRDLSWNPHRHYRPNVNYKLVNKLYEFYKQRRDEDDTDNIDDMVFYSPINVIIENEALNLMERNSLAIRSNKNENFITPRARDADNAMRVATIIALIEAVSADKRKAVVTYEMLDFGFQFVNKGFSRVYRAFFAQKVKLSYKYRPLLDVINKNKKPEMKYFALNMKLSRLRKEGSIKISPAKAIKALKASGLICEERRHNERVFIFNYDQG